MQGARRCGQCNTLNEAERRYCRNCGKYLKINAGKTQQVTIWDLENAKDDARNRDKDRRADITYIGNAKPRKAVICPECKKPSFMVKEIFPLACDSCGYFFQAGIDRVVILDAGEEDGNRKAGTVHNESAGAAVVMPGVVPGARSGQANVMPGVVPGSDSNQDLAQGGPLPRRTTKDTSQMRLLSLTSPCREPAKMQEAGNVLGKDATVWKDFVSQHKLYIWHSPTGWYAKSLAGEPFYNNVPMGTARQVKLADGDMFMLDQEQLRVEIF